MQYEKAPYLDLALGVTEGEGAALTPAVHQVRSRLGLRLVQAKNSNNKLSNFATIFSFI